MSSSNISDNEEVYLVQFELLGILEWLNRKGSSIEKFNDHIIFGRLENIPWRYFVSEGFFCIMLSRYKSGSKTKAWYNRDEIMYEFEKLLEENHE